MTTAAKMENAATMEQLAVVLDWIADNIESAKTASERRAFVARIRQNAADARKRAVRMRDGDEVPA